MASVLEGNPEPPPNFNQLYYHTYFNKDGAILIQKYLKDGLGNTKGSFNDALTDINIYYEDGSTDDAFGTVCYVCMNKNLRYHMLNRDFHLSSSWLCNDIISNYETLRYKPENYVKVNQDILQEAIDYELRNPNGTAGLLSQLIIKLCKSLSGWIRESLYSEINWNPNLNNYDPIFGPPQYKQFGKDWQAFKVKSNHFFNKAKYIGTLCSHIHIVGGMLQGIINFVINIFKTIIDVIDNIVKELVKFFDIVANINAFVCGLLNGITEFVASLFDFIALLITLTDKAERQLIKESLENLYNEFKKHPLEKIKEILTQAFESIKDRYSKKEDYEKAYNAGEDLVSVILIVDGVVAVVKVLKSIPKGFERLAEWAEKNAKKIISDLKRLVKDISVEDIDWIAKKDTIGNFGGNIVTVRQIRRLKEILSKYGVKLILEEKAVFKKYYRDLFYYMRRTNKVGGFNSKTKEFYLLKKSTEIVVFHEQCHLAQWAEIGDKLYSELSILDKETYVWEQIYKHKNLWTIDELKESLKYINETRIEFGEEILNIKL